MADEHEATKQADPLSKGVERLTRDPNAIRELQDLKRATTEEWREDGYGEEVRLFVDENGKSVIVSRRNEGLKHEDVPKDHEYRFAFDGITIDVTVPVSFAGEYEMTRGSGGGIGIYDLDGTDLTPSEELGKVAEKFGSYLYINVPSIDEMEKGVPLSLLGDGGRLLRAYDLDGLQARLTRESPADADASIDATSTTLGRRAIGRDDRF